MSMDTIFTLDVHTMNQIDPLTVLTALEAGQIIYCPNHAPEKLEEEQVLLSEAILHPKHKNISFDPRRQHLSGLLNPALAPMMQGMMQRFSEFSTQLLSTYLPSYSNAWRVGRTSYRPAEIKGRKTSPRKDDTRLHVDAFSATPVNGLRLLRVFSNINPNGAPRVWHLGDSFSTVLDQFASKIPPYNQTKARFLQLIKATKTLRSAYDHQMLSLHDSMKLDDHYQKNIVKTRMDFPPNSTWIAFTDQVSHAALSGQFLLEQTVYLPITAMRNPALSPLKQLERRL